MIFENMESAIPRDKTGPEANSESLSRMILVMECAVIFFFTLFPLLFNLPQRDNLYLSWEGTYRLYMGQLPYKDFGMPIGYGYFIIPFLFFKMFGPFLKTLLYAQVFINLMTILFFRGILREIGLNQAQKFLSVLVFTVSYTFVFFWPWYNNTAIFYQLAAIYMIFLLRDSGSVRYYALLVGTAICTFLALFTKQDYGGLAFMFVMVLLAYTSYIGKDYKRVILFLVFYILTALAFVIPFINDGFLYWFNYGQSPHESRLSAGHFLNEVFGGSPWEKFYLFLIVILALDQVKDFKAFINNRKEVLMLLLSIGIVLEALITKVTSRLPAESINYVHGFAFAYIISHLNLKIYSKNIYVIAVSALLIISWWSATYWKYANRMFKLSVVEEEAGVKPVTKGVLKGATWKAAPFAVYRNVNLPEGTILGIERIKKLEVVQRRKEKLKVLNMSELTPLAHELGYMPERKLPLWYHLNIGMFQKEVDEISGQIRNQKFDLVLFEVVPSLDNFYPEAVRLKLKEHYQQVDSFMAPRKEGDSHIEVFIKK